MSEIERQDETEESQPTPRVSFIDRFNRYAPIIAAIGVLVPIVRILFGDGLIGNVVNEGVLHKEVIQIPSKDFVLSSCIVKNDGRSKVDDLRIEVSYEDGSDIGDLYIEGGEQQWKINYKASDPSIKVVQWDRLVSNDKVNVVASSQFRSELICHANADNAQAVTAQEGFLKFGDFAIIALINGATLFLGYLAYLAYYRYFHRA